MNSQKSFKIEFMSSSEARTFIESTNTNIGGIPLHKESKEQEIDPSIPQCWECGILNPEHNTRNCPGPKKCLKCNDRAHKFYDCPIPKNTEQMSEEHKTQRYCIPCHTRGDHTSLDHRFCATKKKILYDKIKSLRENKKTEENADKWDIDLIKKTLDISNTQAWPALHKYQHQQQKTSTIILLALLEENSHPGSFQTKLDSELKRNGLPTVQYNIGPNVAKSVTNIICATNSSNINRQQPTNQDRTPIIIQTKQNQARVSDTGAMSKFGRDTIKHIKRTDQQTASDNSLHIKTPIPTTVVQNIPFVKPQFVMRCTSSKHNLLETSNKPQHTILFPQQ